MAVDLVACPLIQAGTPQAMGIHTEARLVMLKIIAARLLATNTGARQVMVTTIAAPHTMARPSMTRPI